jgi:transcriptional regulator with XRE-family HTH domain
MKFNFKIINAELKKMGINKSELARRNNMSRQLVNYYFNKNSRATLRKAEQLAVLLKVKKPSTLLID